LKIHGFGDTLAAIAHFISEEILVHELAFLLQSQTDPNEIAQRMMMWILPILLIGYFVVVAILMIPCWFILKKAGFSPWLSLMCIVPSLGTLILLYVLAFAQWKVVPAPQMAYVPPYPQPPLPPQLPPQPPPQQ
jgi:hypothetical protein